MAALPQRADSYETYWGAVSARIATGSASDTSNIITPGRDFYCGGSARHGGSPLSKSSPAEVHIASCIPITGELAYIP